MSNVYFLKRQLIIKEKANNRISVVTFCHLMKKAVLQRILTPYCMMKGHDDLNIIILHCTKLKFAFVEPFLETFPHFTSQVKKKTKTKKKQKRNDCRAKYSSDNI